MIDKETGEDIEGKNEDNAKMEKARKKVAQAHHLDALERLKKQRAIIDARIQSTEARLKTTNRKQDTRRKILIGSYYLDKAVKENTFENLKIVMCSYLTRDSDRKLFSFSPNPDDKNNIIER